jgi:hypothetical protein
VQQEALVWLCTAIREFGFQRWGFIVSYD